MYSKLLKPEEASVAYGRFFVLLSDLEDSVCERPKNESN